MPKDMRVRITGAEHKTPLPALAFYYIYCAHMQGEQHTRESLLEHFRKNGLTETENTRYFSKLALDPLVGLNLVILRKRKLYPDENGLQAFIRD